MVVRLAITLNESLTIGDGNDGTLTFGAGSKTLTVEDDSTVNQDLTDANVTFGSVTTTNNVTVGGDLTVNGSSTTVATTNLVIQDAFDSLLYWFCWNKCGWWYYCTKWFMI